MPASAVAPKAALENAAGTVARSPMKGAGKIKGVFLKNQKTPVLLSSGGGEPYGEERSRAPGKTGKSATLANVQNLPLGHASACVSRIRMLKRAGFLASQTGSARGAAAEPEMSVLSPVRRRSVRSRFILAAFASFSLIGNRPSFPSASSLWLLSFLPDSCVLRSVAGLAHVLFLCSVSLIDTP